MKRMNKLSFDRAAAAAHADDQTKAMRNQTRKEMWDCDSRRTNLSC